MTFLSDLTPYQRRCMLVGRLIVEDPDMGAADALRVADCLLLFFERVALEADVLADVGSLPEAF